MDSKPVSALSRGHPAWAKKAKHMANDFFVVRTVVLEKNPPEPSVQYGIVVKKKLGCAVLRNRIKRRLRCAFSLFQKKSLQNNNSVAYILVVKQASVAQLPFDTLCHHLQSVLKIYG